MKWKKEKCHRIIDESLTNELTQLVKHLFSSPPSSSSTLFFFFLHFFQPPNNQSHLNKKKDGHYARLDGIRLESPWNYYYYCTRRRRRHRQSLIEVISTAQRLLWIANAISIISFIGFAWWNNGTAMTFIRFCIYAIECERANVFSFFFFISLSHSILCVWMSVPFCSFALSLSANDNIINNHQRIKKYNESDSK